MPDSANSPSKTREAQSAPRPQHAAFLRGLVAERPVKRRSPGLAGHLCRRFQIGSASPEGDFIVYQESDYGRAAELLDHWRQALSELTDTSAASGRALLAKLVLRPCRGYLAVLPVNMGYTIPPSYSFITTTLGSARELALDVIVACEKLDTLGQLGQYTWLDRFVRGRQALAIFGGTRGGVYRADTAQRFLSASAAPVLALHDFDPSGLHKASALPRLEALCLPDWAALESVLKRNRREPMFVHQRRQLRDDLDHVECRQVASAWESMNTAGNGIAVENFPR